MFRSLLTSAIALAAIGSAAHAADLRPLQATTVWDGPKSSLMLFYTEAKDGFHVTGITQDGEGSAAKIAKFVAVLPTGASGSMSVPQSMTNPSRHVFFTNSGDHLHVTEATEVASAR